MLPRSQFNTLLTVITDAVERADRGDPCEGYMILLAGIDSVRSACSQGKPWAPELMCRYRQALDEFARRYCVGRA